jgi:hypothetical protein
MCVHIIIVHINLSLINNSSEHLTRLSTVDIPSRKSMGDVETLKNYRHVLYNLRGLKRVNRCALQTSNVILITFIFQWSFLLSFWVKVGKADT